MKREGDHKGAARGSLVTVAIRRAGDDGASWEKQASRQSHDGTTVGHAVGDAQQEGHDRSRHAAQHVGGDNGQHLDMVVGATGRGDDRGGNHEEQRGGVANRLLPDPELPIIRIRFISERALSA